MVNKIEMNIEEWIAKGEKLFGPDRLKWKFVCPSCGNIQSVADFRQFKDRNATPRDANYICIGRLDGHINVPMFTKPGPCNYSSGGLFNINPITIKDGNLKYTSFAFFEKEYN